MLPGYAMVNLHSTYQLTNNIQVYGLVENLFDNKFACFGTFANVELLAAARGSTDPRTVTPAPPMAGYAGVKVKF